MSLFTLCSRGARVAFLATSLVGLAPHDASAQFTVTGPGVPAPSAPAELFGRDEVGFDAPYQTLAQTFQPFVGGGTVGYLQSFTVYMQGANFVAPTVVPTFNASIWTTVAGPPFSLATALRTTSGPTGSPLLEGWKAVTFDFANLALTKNVTYSFVLAVTGYASLPDGAINYVAMNDGSQTGAVLGATNGSSAPDPATSFVRLVAFDEQASRTLAYRAEFTTSVVPEPATIVLLSIGLGVLAVVRRRRAV